MPVTVYRSTDSGAPVLTGLVGSMIALLDVCLVTGYGSKPAAGWSKPYTGTNLAVFRQGGGNLFYLDVDDTSVSAPANTAQGIGYEAMTAVGVGTGRFPAVGNQNHLTKSNTADATPRAWVLVADDRTFYLFTLAGATAGMYHGHAFGDFYSYVLPSDGYRTMLIGKSLSNPAGSNETLDKVSSTGGHNTARAYTGLGGASNFSKHGDTGKGSGSATLGIIAFPNPADGAAWIAPISILDSGNVVRGRMRGLFHWLHGIAAFADGDTVAGSGPYAGHTFLLLKTTGNSAAYCIDITGPWDTN